MITRLLLLFVAVAAEPAVAASFFLRHAYGELVDRGSVTAELQDPRFGCAPPVTIRKRDGAIGVDVRRLPQGAPDQMCIDVPKADLGELSAGWWTVTLNVYEAEGALAETVRVEARVRVPDTSCNRDAWLSSQLFVLHKWLSGSAIAERIARDPGFNAQLGGPVAGSPLTIAQREYALLTYPPLDNPNDKRALLERTGDFLSVEPNGVSCSFSPPPSDALGTVIEYYHEGLDHYFYTASADEARGLDGDSGARGWKRTGKAFNVLLMPACPLAAQQQAAYRFFGRPGVGPSSHVFTVDREECRTVDRSGSWLYEGSPFWATPPNSSGGCTSALEIPLHRVWKPFGESNHRFTTELAVVGEMTAKGWVSEGVAMCVKK